MAMLHLVNKSPYDAGNLATATAYMQAGDALLLIEDAIYAAIKAGKASAMLAGKNVSVLGPDLAARGIGEEKLVEGINIIDYAGFVDLVEANDKVQSWL
jgi:tRNA 2-thiouridine synthesizing protein B